MAAVPAYASTTTLTSPTTLSGNQTVSSTGVTATGAGVTATFDLTTSLSWTQGAQLGAAFDPNLVRQGRQLDVNDSYTRTGAGSMAVTWTLNNLQVSWGTIGPLSLGSPSFSASGACDLMAGGSNYTCHLVSPTVALLDTYPIPGPYVDLGMAADVTVTPQGIATIRQASFAGTPGGNANLTLGETPITDSLQIPCTVGAGDEMTYALGSLSTDAGVDVASSLVFEVGAELPNPLPPFNEIKVPFASPTIPLGDSTSDIVMSGAGASFDFGAVLPNNIPPTASAGGPYSGNEGAPITFDGSGSSSICGFPTLRWDFSDGGVAYGESPQHTFEGPGVYSGLLTATDATGLTSTTTFSVTVSNLPPVANAGPNMSTEWGLPITLNGSAVDPGTNEQSLLSYSWDFGDGSPSASGGVSVSHSYSLPGSYTATLTACDPENACGTSTTQVVVNQRGTTLSYTGATASEVTDLATYQASLVDDTGAPVVGGLVQFFADGSFFPFASATTNAAGTASVMYAFPVGNVGTHTVVAQYAGDTRYLASSSSTSFAVSKDGTGLKYTGPVSSKPSKSVAFSATLTDDLGRALAGQTVTFALGTQGCTATTNSVGVAACSIAKLTQKSGNYIVTVGFAGTADYLAATSNTAFTIG